MRVPTTARLQSATVLVAALTAVLFAATRLAAQGGVHAAGVAPGGGPVSRTASADVVGRVLRAEDGTPVAGAVARLVDLDALARSLVRDPARIAQEVVGCAGTQTTDADGGYRFDAVRPGRYAVAVTFAGTEPGSPGQIVLNDCLLYRCDPVHLPPVAPAAADAAAEFSFDDLPGLLSVPCRSSRDAWPGAQGRLVHRIVRGDGFVRLGALSARDAACDPGARVTIRLPEDVALDDAQATLVSARSANPARVRYLGWRTVTTGPSGRVARFEGVPAGRHFLLVGPPCEVVAAGYVDVTASGGEETIAPRWGTLETAPEPAPAVPAAPAEIRVSFLDAGAVPSLGRAISASWGTASVLDGFPSRRHRMTRARLRVVEDPRVTCVLTAQSGELVGTARAPAAQAVVAIALGPGRYVYGRTPVRAADLVICSSDGWDELALLPQTASWRVGPFPQGRYVACASVVASRHAIRVGNAGFSVDPDGPRSAVPISLEGTFGPSTGACVFGWPPAGFEVFLFRDGKRTSAIPCRRDDSGFAAAKVDRRDASMTVLFVPDKLQGPTFGTMVHFAPGRHAVEFPVPRTGPLALDGEMLARSTSFELQIVRGEQADFFVQAWSRNLAGETAITLPRVPCATYRVRYVARGVVVGEAEVDVHE